MKKILITIIAFSISCSFLFADHYGTSSKHPPSGQCKPGSYSGYHNRTYIRDWLPDSVVASISGSWSVGSGGSTPWSLAGLSAGGASISAASGTMKGKHSGMGWFIEIKDALLEISDRFSII